MTTVRRLFMFLLFIAVINAANPPPAPKASGGDNAASTSTWGYIVGENGPDQWAQLNRKEWGTCSTSHMQSPVHIIDFKYKCDGQCDYDQQSWTGDPQNTVQQGQKRLSLNGLRPITQTAVHNNGHTLVVNVPKNHEAMYTTFEGREYELLQYHFHRAAEHLVNGLQYPLEMHMVHRRKGGSDNDLLVVGVFFEVKQEANLFLNALNFVENGLPSRKNERRPIVRHANPLGVLDSMSVYNDAATQEMRDSMVLSLKLSLTGRALSPATIAAFKAFKQGWDTYANTRAATQRSLQELYYVNNPYPEARQNYYRAPLENTQAYHDTHEEWHPIYKKKMYEDGFYDIMFLDPEGNLFYSVHKEPDYATNFESTGRYGSTGLGKVYRAARSNPQAVHEVPWEEYSPSGGVHASFVATGVMEGGKLLGVFVVRLPPEVEEQAKAQAAAAAEKSSSGGAASGGHRRRAAPPPAAASDSTAVGEAIVRTDADTACALRLNNMRIDAGCHSELGQSLYADDGHRRRASTGGASKCPYCPTPAQEKKGQFAYWTYDGSLTTPPCSEGVKWVVMQDIAFATINQLQAFPFRNNFRPPQPLFARTIYSGSRKAWQWGYSAANGPSKWAENGFTFCNGEHQSPIDIRTDKVRTYTHFDFIPQYEPQYNLYVSNTGRSVDVQLRLTKSHISLETGVKASFEYQEYYLTDIRFHKDSEHTVDGKKYEMEAQFHHRQEGDHNLAPHMVVSVLFTKGECNMQLDQLSWGSLPQNRDTIGMHVPDAFLVEDLMPMSRRYWTYDGTLTSPPCTPGVTWVILQESRTICQRQLDVFPLSNSRVVQPIDDRTVQVGSFRPSDGVSDDFWHWDYYHQFRPTTWGRYYQGCTGSRQSPINIITDEVQNHGNTYHNKRLILKWHPMCGLRTRNNGHTIVVDMPAGMTDFEEVYWRVLKFHFHAPSETQIDGHTYPLEMHITHADTNLQGRYLVISILFYKGTDNQFLNSLDWEHLPPLPHSKAEEETREVPRQVDLEQMINNKNSGLEYWQYEGSLTTPPCTEGVKWVVMAHADHLSSHQLLLFYNVLHHANFRTPQPLAGRVVGFNSQPHEIAEKDLWGYGPENGPSTWGAAGFPHCLEKHQSPIDIETNRVQKHEHYGIDWSEYGQTLGSGTLKLINDHNRIMEVAGFPSHSNKITFEGQFYFLVDILYHRNAETRINGKTHDFEMHLIHKNDVNQYMYIAVLFKEGKPNAALDKLMWNEMPNMLITDLNQELKRSMPINSAWSPMEIIDSLGLDKSKYPQGPTYWHYDGSMSTPPCDEGATWIVIEQIAEMSYAQLAQYPFKGSVRPVMPMNGRIVHHMSSVDVPALLAASKHRHEHGELVHSAAHHLGATKASGAKHSGGHRRRAEAPAAAPAGYDMSYQWGYGIEDGPMKWAYDLPTCIGYTQSPISINECNLVRRQKNKMFPQWKFTEGLKIANDGHSLVVSGIKDSYTEYEGVRYELSHFNFHSGSEHLLHDEQYPLELHLVHTLEGRPALVIGIIFDVGPANVDLTALHFEDVKALPMITGKKTDINLPFNPIHFMPYNKNYYTYDGSLTTPPCTEGIRWVVMQSTMSASNAQIANFPFHTNYRNPQNMYGRPVYFMSQQDQYLYETEVTGSSSALHTSWAVVLSTLVALLALVH